MLEGAGHLHCHGCRAKGKLQLANTTSRMSLLSWETVKYSEQFYNPIKPNYISFELHCASKLWTINSKYKTTRRETENLNVSSGYHKFRVTNTGYIADRVCDTVFIAC
jgi:hypothetical protein